MIQETDQGTVRIITLNRPDKANALTEDMLNALIGAIDVAEKDKAAAVILTGAGKVFSAGADLEAAKQGLATSPLWEELSSKIADLSCPSIAALNGTLAGGAFGMVLACDIRISVPKAKFFYPVMSLGFLPQPSDPPRLVELIGRARASMILTAGQKILADEALTWGLVDRLEDDPLTAALELTKPAKNASEEHRAAIVRMIR